MMHHWRKTHLTGALTVVFLLFAMWLFSQPGAAQGGYEWAHWDLAEGYQDYATGKSALATGLDAIEAAGWDVRFIVPRPAGGYSVVGRGPKGTYTPQPVQPVDTPPSTSHSYGAPVATITCPGPHHACRVLPAGTYERAAADRIGG
jgi:hypothetical protein